MQGRVSWSWLAIGTIAVIGAYWLSLRCLHIPGVDHWAVPYLGHVLGAGIAGGVMVAHVPLRPWREPLAAGVLAIAVLSVIWIVLPHARFSWVAGRADSPAPIVLAIAALSGASALGGAMIVRQFASARPGTASLFVLSATVISGTTVIATQLVTALALVSLIGGMFVVIAFVAVAVGGALTQMISPVRRPWVCGSGTAIYALVEVSRSGASGLPLALGGALVLVLVGQVGARIGWKLVRHDDASPDVPPARVQ